MGPMLRSLGLCAVLAVLHGCSVNPVTGASEFSLMSADQELAVGRQQYGPAQQSQGGVYTVDPDLGVYVSEVGRKLARVSDRGTLPYEFVVLNNDVPNAWALPGGKIAINRGLLLQLQDEAQLAAVLGHEIVHAAAGHSAQQMTRSTLLGIGAQVAGVAASGTEYGQLVSTGAQMGSAMYQAHYGRSQELEADHYGMTYMARAGYAPQAAVELQQTFVKLSQGQQSNWLNDLFASHPPSQQRVDANRKMAATLPAGTRNKAAFERATQQLRRDTPAYQAHIKAQQAAANQQWAEAKSLVDTAISKQPKEPLFYTTRGELQLRQQQFQGALQDFSKANSLYPEYVLPLLGKGLAAKALKKYDVAEQALEQSVEQLPTQIAVFHLGEINLAQGERDNAVKWFQLAAQAGGELGEKSNAYLQQLQTQAQ
ncbi:M48 family metalloprotease [Pseudomaricurvus sp. HS19]|uniref:M48 family metalloprotease n=1 Tax=Pseudomaricurvus sp. HS19 TaxID=2692626 RepID=UPI0013697A5C|nr:M48 family metallopeptidase [Pseudomaricurvus sp. HS19]MYM63814.1 M48 family metalloprotease [Pseudomaricurvus sp. HS19]